MLSGTVVKTVVTADRTETAKLAHQLAGKAFTGMVLLLSGDLGSGKTTFMQSFGHSLGITELITSPTFTLINEYHQGRLPLYHMDLYRLEPNQTKGLNIGMYWQGDEMPLGVVAIEWAERLSHLPTEYLQIKIRIMADQLDDMADEISLETQGRIFELTAVGQSHAGLLESLISS